MQTYSQSSTVEAKAEDAIVIGGCVRAGGETRNPKTPEQDGHCVVADKPMNAEAEASAKLRNLTLVSMRECKAEKLVTSTRCSRMFFSDDGARHLEDKRCSTTEGTPVTRIRRDRWVRRARTW